MRTNTTTQFGLAVVMMFAGVGALLGLCATGAITEDTSPRPVIIAPTSLTVADADVDMP